MKSLGLQQIKTLFTKHKNRTDTKYASISRARTDIYVSTNGNDETGDGSIEKPFATIQKAIDSLGDLCVLSYIYIEEGTYEYEDTISIPSFKYIRLLKMSGKQSPLILVHGLPGLRIYASFLIIDGINLQYSNKTCKNTDWMHSLILGDTFSSVLLWNSTLCLASGGNLISSCHDLASIGTQFIFKKDTDDTTPQVGVKVGQGGRVVVASTSSVMNPTSQNGARYPEYGYSFDGGTVSAPKNFWNASTSDKILDVNGNITYVDPTA